MNWIFVVCNAKKFSLFLTTGLYYYFFTYMGLKQFYLPIMYLKPNFYCDYILPLQ